MEVGDGNGWECFVGVIGGAGGKQVGHVLESVAVCIPALITVISVYADPAMLPGYGGGRIIIIPGACGYGYRAIESGSDVFFQHDIDDGLPLCIIFCRRVGDDLHPVDGAGRNGLQYLCDRAAADKGAFAVNQDFQVGRSAQAQIAVGVHLQGRNVLQEVCRGTTDADETLVNGKYLFVGAAADLWSSGGDCDLGQEPGSRGAGGVGLSPG